MKSKKGGPLKSSKAAVQDYVVEAIRDFKVDGNAKRYLVKWKGYPETENTWEPLKNLASARGMIDEYHRLNKDEEMEGSHRRKPGRPKRSQKPVPDKPPSIITVNSSSPSSLNKAEQPESPIESDEKEDSAQIQKVPSKVRSKGKSKPAAKHKVRVPIVNENKEQEEDEQSDIKPVPPKKKIHREPVLQPQPRARRLIRPMGNMGSSDSDSEEEKVMNKPAHLSKEAQMPPEKSPIQKVTRTINKNGVVHYQVLYANRVDTDPQIRQLEASVVLAQNPTALALFFENEVRLQMGLNK